ncbi:MAG: PEP-utilizing enzyme [archaeon]
MRWKIIAYFSVDVLSEWLIHYGNLHYFNELFCPYDDFLLHWVYINGEVLYKEKEINEWNRIVEKRGQEFVVSTLDKIKKEVSLLEEVKQSKDDLKTRLYRLFRIGASSIANALLEQSSLIMKNNLSKKYNLSEKKIAEILYESIEKTEMVSEHRDFLNVITEIKKAHPKNPDFKDKKVVSLIENHLKKYAFLGMNYFGGSPWNFETIKNKIKQEWNSTQKEKKPVTVNVNFSKEDKKTIELLKEIIFLRTSRNESITKTCYSLYDEITEKAKTLELTYEEFTNLTPEEMFSGNTKPIQERIKGFGIILENNEIKVIVGEELKVWKEKVIGKNKSQEIKGMITNPGKVTGEVQIVNELYDFSKFKKGNILVSKYTTPKYTPAIVRAKAIVTDVGGITSHAAIISKEIGIPCIVGTGNATQVLKDGDIVEVDANKGIVKKL